MNTRITILLIAMVGLVVFVWLVKGWIDNWIDRNTD